ncbi:class I SAM-dependent methyltransferase [Goodfellowiella coeruleoviolacea]|uniref:O-Methyltransferase involved in polyketide biosynthesis n=1 Tax=Goodfellowiella coeruleoviolacea TaxID=334858 RepID=A0AAE3KJ09_9PSEU|nr:hypothetical protein [Goodfellowiella coeruleoviolacea]MCP2169070.1 O-Methyltransferase involved in polyketide biosynthesis [Goodfellowiella coeruleoviolacea]
MTDKVKLSAEQEPLLVPVYSRVLATRKQLGGVVDPKAEEIVQAIDYDFGQLDSAHGIMEAAVRAALHDRWVRAFLRDHPDGTVVEVGAGLSTRFERVAKPVTHWVNVDQLDAIGLRKVFFTESDRRHTVASALCDEYWLPIVARHPGPHLFVVAEALQPLSEVDVRTVLGRLAASFPGALLAIDTVREAPAGWSCPDPRELTDWGLGLRLVETRTATEVPADLDPPLLPRFRRSLRWAGSIARKAATSVRLNLFEVAGSAGLAGPGRSSRG